MDKKIRSQLSQGEREYLETLWDHPLFPKVINKLAGLKNLQIAQIVLEGSVSHEFTVHQRGKAEGVVWLSSLLQQMNKDSKKDSTKTSNT